MLDFLESSIGPILGAMVGACIAWLISLYKSHKGNIIVVEQILQTSQVNFKPAVQKELEIIYHGQKINDLVLTQFIISNQGDNVIKPLKLTFKVTPKVPSLSFVNCNTEDPQNLSTWTNSRGMYLIDIDRPYLNPVKKYKDEKIQLSFFSDAILDFQLIGGGEDWGSKLKDRLKDQNILKRLLRSLIPLGAFMTIFSIINSTDNQFFHYEPDGIFIILLFSVLTMVEAINLFIK